MTETISQPAVTVVVVIDYKVGDDETLGELKKTLRALGRQDFDEPAQFLLVEPLGVDRHIPVNGEGMPEGLRVVHVPAETSYDLKNAGAREAKTDLVVILDADCVPEPQWLRSVVMHHRAHPHAAAISGLTLYPGDGLLPRAFALIDRSYVDSGGPGRTRAISNNNAAVRRDAMMRHPLRNDLGTFGSKIHSDEIMADGGELRFEPQMIAWHAYDGWNMQRLARRHVGYAMARYRLTTPGLSHEWMFRLGVLGLPFILAMSVAGTWKNCLKRWKNYRLAWYEVPLAMAIAIPVHAYELPGVITAMRNRELAYGDGFV